MSDPAGKVVSKGTKPQGGIKMSRDKFYRYTRKSRKLPEGFDEEMFEHGKTVYIKKAGRKASVFFKVDDDGVISQVDELDIPAVPRGAREVSEDTFEENAF